MSIKNWTAGDEVKASELNSIATAMQNSEITYALTTGSANAYVLTLAPAISGYIAGQTFKFKANFANTGAVTLDVNSKGAIAIKKYTSTALVANDIVVGQDVIVIYDGTNFQIVSSLGNPPGAFGAWTHRSSGTEASPNIFQAATDLILIATTGAGAEVGVIFNVYTDAANPPTVRRGYASQTTGPINHTVTVPVKKNDYYKIVATNKTDTSNNFYTLALGI